MKKRTKVIIALAALVTVAVIMAVIAVKFGPKPKERVPEVNSETGEVVTAVEVTIKVMDKAGDTTSYTVKTEALYLRGAMEDADGLTFSGTESEAYGMMVDTINGVRADYTLDGAYWSFYVNDEYCNYGIDSQPVNDGDVFGIVYTPAQ